jgi:hypothetical protein
MDNYIVVGIDGTGSKGWMQTNGRNSHTYKFVEDFKGGTADGISKKWFHGTSDNLLDRESDRIVQQALDFIIEILQRKFPQKKISKTSALELFDMSSCKQSEYYMEMKRKHNNYGSNNLPYRSVKTVVSDSNKQILTTEEIRIVLVGHSRGAMATTVLAKMLSPIVKVYFMGMYDSVDKNDCLDSTVLENVKYVFHAIRSKEVNSRNFFGNSSTVKSSSVDEYIPKEFFTSHGGVGGDPVTNPKKSSITGDSSCIPQPTELYVVSEYGTTVIDNTNLLSRRFNKSIDDICIQGRDEANAFIRNAAKSKGLPI